MRTQKSVILSVFCCTGILLGLARTYFEFDISTNLIISVTILTYLIFKHVSTIYLLALLLCYNIGVARAMPFVSDINLMKDLLGQEVLLTGTIVDDLSYHESGQREFHIDHIKMHEPTKTDVNGRLRIRSYSATNMYRGDKIAAEGKVYRALGNRHGSIQYASLQKIESGRSLLEKFRLNFFASTHSVIPDPQSSLGLGFLVGVGNMLSDELDQNLRTVGLTHIVAVSGYNLTILVVLTRRLMANSSKIAATAVAVGLISVFLLLTGGAPSIVRASIVSFLSLTAWYYGRNINALVLLLMSAAISAYINPYYLWKDIGWYLSFTAFFGVLVLAPLIAKRLYKGEPKLVGQLLIETCCAQILTFPIIAYIFGDVSIISILANLLVLPLVPLAMSVTFLAGVANMIVPSIAGLIAMPARFVLNYIVQVTNALSTVPGALVKLNISLSQLVICYGLIIFLCMLLYIKSKNRDKISYNEHKS